MTRVSRERKLLQKKWHFFLLLQCEQKSKILDEKAISPFREKPTNDHTSPDLMDLQNVGKLLNQVYALISELYVIQKTFLIYPMFRNTESSYRISSNSAWDFIASFWEFYC